MSMQHSASVPGQDPESGEYNSHEQRYTGIFGSSIAMSSDDTLSISESSLDGNMSSVSPPKTYRKNRRLPTGWPLMSRAQYSASLEGSSGNGEANPLSKEDADAIERFFASLSPIPPSPSTPENPLFARQPPSRPSSFSDPDPDDFLPASHQYKQAPPRPELSLRGSATTDWAAYLTWAEAELSFRERVDSNVLLVNVATAHAISAEETCAYLEPQVRTVESLVLFKDLPFVGKDGGVSGREVWVLGYDPVSEQFVVTWLEDVPESLKGLAREWEEGQQVLYVSLGDVCRVLEKQMAVEDVFGGSPVCDLGFQIALLICMGLFVVDFQDSFRFQVRRVGPLRQALREWRLWLEDFSALGMEEENDEMVIEEADIADQDLSELQFLQELED